jgi:hypothetical protein
MISSETTRAPVREPRYAASRKPSQHEPRFGVRIASKALSTLIVGSIAAAYADSLLRLTGTA